MIGTRVICSGGSGILASILVLLLQGSNVLTIPSKLKNHSKKKGERKNTGRRKKKIGERNLEQEVDWIRLKKFRENWRKQFEEGFAWPKMVFRDL
jgi:hypothetical protein